ncbi:putative heme d1 biosynthesis radical SAM protein NirJ1 [Desulfuribacillus stibiiarsenatis]|uniref:Mycofactocin maturase MftC n=1 Tax=Desulfuribacillus stibiiarsenatis TaxID=1390249 RepID=A0A1E5L3I4_9FIRM|nr:putative heme d1 biosynthesis radical SAM protein NirJ1 [Desulfuribacillus stibiiarsenatis]OEH84700.1 putative heme d1 biosynthesis radical SAM protein NirJ1 [Desulfuribacillus stibiiarsenatis]
MIGISRLLCGSENFGDSLRYAKGSHGQTNGAVAGHGPVVVWTSTKTCNLKCVHCYAASENIKYEGELSTDEAKVFIDDLANFKVPVLLFSGGEPLVRPDTFELAEYAASKGIRVTYSTNGLLIDKDVAKRMKQIGVGYVGISFDGIGAVHDEFRGLPGAFEKSLQAVKNCIEVDQKVGLRFTINQHNYRQLHEIFDFLEEENIPRACFYHLVYSGRGNEMVNDDLTHEESRHALDIIMERTVDFHKRGITKEILTVDNHADAIYLYLRAKELYPDKADEIYNLIKTNGGNRSGIAFGNVDNLGNVHPDQFTQNITFGNIREKKFSEIWSKAEHPILNGLKDRQPLLKGRCSQCKWLSMCNGNFRSRAHAIHNDFWESDPACYLTDEEIGLTEKA